VRIIRRFALGHYWTVVQLLPEPSRGFAEA
jgi:hypothetical protein